MATENRDVIIERTGGGALTVIVTVIVIALIAVGAYAVIQTESRKDDAISRAADDVGDAAKDVGDAARDAAKKAP